MQGTTLGGFASGLMGGVAAAKGFSNPGDDKPNPPPTPVPANGTPGFGLGQPLVTGPVGDAQYAGDVVDATGTGSSWGSLKKIMSEMGGEATPTSLTPKTIGPYSGYQGATNG